MNSKKDNKLCPSNLQYVIDNWNRLTSAEIANNLGISVSRLVGWVAVLRKGGIVLARPRMSSSVIKRFIRDYKEANK